jgi:ATP-binding cassette subfamily B protein/subfamily B ATP-binding cassette protein MsbA
MAFQWYQASCLLNPVWSIVNSFSELQRYARRDGAGLRVLGMPADKPDRPDARMAPRVVR